MESQIYKSALMVTSSISDLLRSGGKVSVTGLDSFYVNELLAADHLIHRAEVSQVLTLSVSAITPAASTTYTVQVGNNRNVREGAHTELLEYSYTTLATIGTAAATKTLIVDALAAAIQARTGNFISATSDGVDAVTITDDAGYYPARPGINKGPSSYALIRGLAPASLATMTVTAAGVVSVGDGTRLLTDAPVYDNLTGNLISGEINGQSTAVAGQFYSIFDFTFAKSVSNSALSGLKADKVLRQRAYVDNGAGASTANLAGYNAFLKAFERLMYLPFKDDPNSQITFLDAAPVYAAKAGGLATGTTGDENIIQFMDAQLDHHVLGTQTILYPPWTTSGLDLVQDVADNDGSELSAPIEATSPIECIVGQEEFSFRIELNVGDITDLNPFAVGLRKKEAYQADYNNYDAMAAFAVDSAADETGTTKNLDIHTIIDGAATQTDDTTVDWADAETRIFEVRVDINGLCTFLIDDVDVSGVQTPAFSFTDAEVIIPFVNQIAEGAADSGLTIRRWAFIPKVLKR